jgi:hypothetical protein
MSQTIEKGVTADLIGHLLVTKATDDGVTSFVVEAHVPPVPAPVENPEVKFDVIYESE